MSLYPLPAVPKVTVGQTGTKDLWNNNVPGAANFLANRPYAYLTQLTSQSISISGFTPIAFDGGSDNTGAAHSTTVNNSRYTCQLPGLYYAVGQLGFQPPLSGTNPFVQVQLRVNGDVGQIWGQRYLYSDNTGGLGGTGQIMMPFVLKLGDYIELIAFNGSTAAVHTWTGTRAARLFVHWVST